MIEHDSVESAISPVLFLRLGGLYFFGGDESDLDSARSLDLIGWAVVDNVLLSSIAEET